MVRLADPKAGFRPVQVTCAWNIAGTASKPEVSLHVIQTTRVPGTTWNAREVVTKKAREHIEFRQKIRELIDAGRRTNASHSSAISATSRQLSPNQKA